MSADHVHAWKFVEVHWILMKLSRNIPNGIWICEGCQMLVEKTGEQWD